MVKEKKTRLDRALVERGLVSTRTKAQSLIMAGLVYNDTGRLDKAGMQISNNMMIKVKSMDHPWVSRGGVKLASALKKFHISVSNLVCLDIGASTGGFSDVLLDGGAVKVYAVDVGHGQLAWKIRNDPRVIVKERLNARYITRKEVPDLIDFICCDTSFIGLQKVLPFPMKLARKSAKLVALIKPQFEASRSQVESGGIINDSEIHEAVCDRISQWFTSLENWTVIGIEQSPITGPKGNIEFLIAAQRL